FSPRPLRGTFFFLFPGGGATGGGGANWGGAAYDPARNLLIVNMNNVAHHIQLIPAEQVGEARKVFHDQEVSPQAGASYGMKREILLSPLDVPCTPPPWGVLAAVDLGTGRIVWRKPLGEMMGVTLGLPTLGGPIMTASGLTFIGGTMDDRLRAFDSATGELLMDWKLPAAGQATPMTYRHEGRQYVVIQAGGNPRAEGKLGDAVLAFALP
ncbi:MAG: pyrroloquinoline quinone-dependent dehydrogenase, partial [Gammaproteobacteria bacterium]|nr:pyrroloquinoline quinone-dependent dehydrogenase [Gammaproteobacteria bacterium]